MNTAIVTDVKYRMSLAVIRDLAARGVRVIACETEGEPFPLGFVSASVSRAVTLPRGDGGAALLALCAQTAQEDGAQPALLPVGAVTQALAVRRRAAFEKVCGVLLPEEETLDLFNDKQRVRDAANALGIPVPRDFDGGFPAVVKPLCGEKFGLTAAARYAIVRDTAALEKSKARFRDITGKEPVAQEYLPGGAAGCSVLAKDGAVLASICHRRVREYPVTGGPSSCCERVFLPELEAYAAAMIRHYRYSGLAMFEFKAGADGAYRLLEINPRVWGTYPLTRACGSNFSYLWYRAALGDIKEPFVAGAAVKMAYYPSDLAALAGYLKHGKIKTAAGAFCDLLDPRVKNGLREKGDPAPGRMYCRSLWKR